MLPDPLNCMKIWSNNSRRSVVFAPSPSPTDAFLGQLQSQHF
jgi:hypothetical protein